MGHLRVRRFLESGLPHLRTARLHHVEVLVVSSLNSSRNAIMNIQSLVFQSIQFDIVDRNGQPWLRSPQIAEALGYGQANRITDVYNRNADEFTDRMTAVVKLQDLHPRSAEAAQTREVRIFSLRGAHLLGMFSRTKKAKEFRKWVLDVLDSHVSQPAEQTAFQAAHEQALAYFNACRESVRAAGGTLPEWPEPNPDIAKGL